MTQRPKSTKPIQPERLFEEDLDRSVGFLVSDTARHVKRLLYHGLADHNIRGGSWFVLRALWEQDGVTQRELADRLGMTQPSTLEMLRAMEKDGLVRFEKDTVDRRKLRIFVTDHAMEKKPALMRVAREANAVLLEGFSPAEEMLLKRMLHSVRTSAAAKIAHYEMQANGKEPPIALDLKEEAREGLGGKTKPSKK